MNEKIDIEVKRLSKRIKLLLLEKYALIGGAAGAVIAAVLVILSPRVTALLDYRLWAAAVILGALVGCAAALIKKLDPLTIAIAADENTGLKERLSTALALKDSAGEHEFVAPLMEDACRGISGIPASDVFHRRYGLPHIIFASALLILACAIFIPQMSLFQSPERKKEITVMKEEGKKMVAVAKEIKDLSGPDDEKMRALAANIEKFGKKMETGRMDKKQAMLKSRKLSEDVRKEQDRLAKENSSTKSMQQARADMKKAADELARKMESEMKKVPSDKRLVQLAGKKGPLTEAEKQELREALQKYTEPGSTLQIPKELGEALLKLAENDDYKKAMEIMQDLLKKSQGGEMSEIDRETLKKQLEAMAKALENTDLDELAKQMRENAEKLAQMSPEEIEKMIEQAKKTGQVTAALKKAEGT